ncbi:uncharacterized protein J4E79_007624 [Alternaria viburni]|uniref:uncharacterized protein n=1 Tax=Alternaria viburni TaxID=566460 RepID=UPI0020C5A152|nr:uncharacterized protein J4E79_007624 [Alternaria viburni]KAI4657009.1 hypothetical protein J4E79_007624 [Alternaria viburni]
MATARSDEKATASSPGHDAETAINPTSTDKDLAINLVGECAQEIDPAIEVKVLRKIDWFLIPAMIVGYGLVYYDKAILGSAALFGMTTDLHLTQTLSPATYTSPAVISTTRLSWATSLFYFGMLAGLYPLTFALQRFNLGRILGAVVLLWSLICMLTAAVTDYRGFYYTQREQSVRQSWWFSSTGLFTIIGGALNYGFAQITSGALRRWQYIYLLAGCLTFLFGCFCFFIPNSCAEAWFLTKNERVVAVERLRKGATGVRCQKIKMYQLRECVTDVKFYLVFLLMGSAYTVNGAVSGFGPLIVNTFGWSPLASILWQFPLGLICLVTILLCGWSSSRIPNIRIILLIVNCLPVIAGCAMIWKSSWTYHAPTPVAGYSIIGTFGAVVSQTIVIAMSNVSGATKKSAMAGTVFVAYCVGNIVGPLLIRSQEKGQHYPRLWTGLIICYCITIASAVALYVHLKRENAKRDEMSVDEGERDKLAFMDLTDKENVYFRYVL